jgi:acyl carrier protein
MTPPPTESVPISELVDIIRKVAKVPPRVPITHHSRLVEDLAIDSLDLVRVILQLQDQFDVVIDDDAVPNLCRVADLATYLAERTGAGPSCKLPGEHRRPPSDLAKDRA